MKVKIEKSYVNCYYIILFSILLFGYTIRSSIFYSVFGYMNIIFYICMSIILLRWVKYINFNIIIVAIIFSCIVYVDILTCSTFEKFITSILTFVLPLLLFCVDYKRIVKNKERFIYKSIKILNFFVLVIFCYMIVDLFSGCLLTKTLSIIFPKLIEYIPNDTGFLQFRSVSYLGHELYTKHFILVFYILNMLYLRITFKALMNIMFVHIISIIGMALSGSKLGILILLFLIICFNFKSKNRFINFILIFIGLLIINFLGVFDFVINRFTTTTLTTGRFLAWDMISETLPNIKLLGGSGENLTANLLETFNQTQVTAALEYPFRTWLYRYGFIPTILILYELYFKLFYKFIKSKNMIFIISYFVIIVETSAFNQLVYNPDFCIAIIMWNIILDCMFNLYQAKKDSLGEESHDKEIIK
ncbi:hypothetical protein QOZ83_10760 [Romboutsia sedimentorum]|uniref:hypothetical protein n=1 Tax=Romboutsia sedimentorum TaxID=1368474 RepID=UPI0024DE6946|nr:hypothetical protein [Romboutsia sedimentorum]MDK2586343.1 hypothetical protein [Romboutsia sedimentorum]